MSNETVKLTFLGDAMFDYDMAPGLPNYQKGAGYDFSSIFAPIKSLLARSDYVLANLETPISASGIHLTEKRFNFCTDAAFAKALRDAGVHFLSTANNHCLDRGMDGLISTVECLDRLGIHHSGTYAPGTKRKPLMVTAKGLRLGILSYTYGTNAMANANYLPFAHRRAVDLIQEQECSLLPFDPLRAYLQKRPGGRVQRLRDRLFCFLWPQNKGREQYEWETWNGYRRMLLARDIAWLKKNRADKIAILLHIGGQYNREPNSFTMKMTRWLEKKGVALVIANHEHVVHGSKCRDGCVTTYALGNLVGSAGTARGPMGRRSEYSVALHVYIDKNSKQTTAITYSILRTVCNADQSFEVWPVTDLITAFPEQQDSLLREALLCAADFSGHAPGHLEEEFPLWSAH